MKKQKFSLSTMILLLTGFVFVCGVVLLPGAVSRFEKEKPELISPLGKKFYAHPATGEELVKLRKDLTDAIKELEANPEDSDNIIMYGRRLAYLWRYHEAIEVYSKGIAKFPENAMLYRHRGHRFISTRQYDKAVTDLTKASGIISVLPIIFWVNSIKPWMPTKSVWRLPKMMIPSLLSATGFTSP